MSRKSRWRFFCMEHCSQYHFGLWSVEGERRSYALPKKSFPSESFISAVPTAPHALHDTASGSILSSIVVLLSARQILQHRFANCPPREEALDLSVLFRAVSQ